MQSYEAAAVCLLPISGVAQQTASANQSHQGLWKCSSMRWRSACGTCRILIDSIRSWAPPHRRWRRQSVPPSNESWTASPRTTESQGLGILGVLKRNPSRNSSRIVRVSLRNLWVTAYCSIHIHLCSWIFAATWKILFLWHTTTRARHKFASIHYEYPCFMRFPTDLELIFYLRGFCCHGLKDRSANPRSNKLGLGAEWTATNSAVDGLDVRHPIGSHLHSFPSPWTSDGLGLPCNKEVPLGPRPRNVLQKAAQVGVP